MPDAPNELDLVISLLPSSPNLPILATNDEDEDVDVEEVLRDTTLLLMRLLYGQAQTQLIHLNQELELLRSVPPQPPESEIEPRRKEDTDWKLDAPRLQDGPLLDPKGKVCFTESSFLNEQRREYIV